MHIAADTLDDLVRRTLAAIKASGRHITPRRGTASELTGVLLELSNPLARLSTTETRGKIFSALGELCWYLSKRDDLAFMTYYLPSYSEHVEIREGKVTGAYGPRLFNRDGMDQMANALGLLANEPASRKAVLVVLDTNDLNGQHAEVPCTCSLQLLLRDSSLEMFVAMRSNDVHLGLVHDVFAFTMLQEIAARTLHVNVGVYKHFVGSLHLYDRDRESAEAFLNEGWQSSSPMPSMPQGDPSSSIKMLLEAENQLREGRKFEQNRYSTLDPYWLDLMRLLQAFRYKKEGSLEGIHSVARDIAFEVYRPLVYGALESLDEEAQSRRRDLLEAKK